jgi:hypothetical protein
MSSCLGFEDIGGKPFRRGSSGPEGCCAPSVPTLTPREGRSPTAVFMRQPVDTSARIGDVARR